MTNLAGVDLNLLVVLDALLEEQHVTRAGHNVGLSQPAVSSALSRLRALLNDELLERDGRRMRLTERAHQLREPLSEALQDIRNLLDIPTDFDPATSPFTLRLFASDMVSFVLLPALRERLKKDAPHAKVTVKWGDREDTADMLASEAVDVAVGHYGDLPEEFLRRPLYEEEMVIVARRGHPIFAESVTLETFVTYPRIQTSLEGRTFTWIEQVVGRLGFAAQNDLAVAHPLVAPMVAWKTDLITITSKRFADEMSQYLDIDQSPVPFDIEGLGIEMIWHKSSDSSPAMNWARQVLLEVASDL